jgi:hypothetical protein
MGIVIIFVIIPVVGFILTGTVLKTILYINKTKDYKLLLWGFFLGVIEMFIIIYKWKIEGEINAFSHVLTPFNWMIFLSAITLILTFIPQSMVKKISNILSVNVITLILLTIILAFTTNPLYELLNIEIHY